MYPFPKVSASYCRDLGWAPASAQQWDRRYVQKCSTGSKLQAGVRKFEARLFTEGGTS